ncbi:MAG TPA: DUF418 domain-containing protein [Phycisphaerales bacterium]|nr:DUF418 domain-containing protein [Phycisphaerales bacterium]
MADRLTAAPVGATQRIESLDVLRGFAVLGILVMNIMTFAMPLAAYMNPTVYPELTPLNQWTFRVVHVVFDLKMMALFSMLFGAGAVVWASKPEERERPGALRAVWLRRMGWLLVIGMIHAWLLWEGDILVTYALCGLLVLWWIRRLPAPWLLGAAGVLFAVHALLNAFAGWITAEMFAESSVITSGMSPEELGRARSGMLEWMDPTQEQVAEQLDALRGSWWDTFEHRAGSTLMFQLQALPMYLFWRAAALMALGAALMKWRVFTGERSARFYAGMAVAGYALGLPLVLAGLLYNESHGYDVVRSSLVGSWGNLLGSVPVALGHAGVLLLVVRLGLVRTVTLGLARAGQMAFTNYLMQSVLCSLIFYGFGLGLAGELNRPAQALVAVGIWLVEILWSVAWLSRFRFGPAEWLWRSLTYWRLQPMRLDAHR